MFMSTGRLEISLSYLQQWKRVLEVGQTNVHEYWKISLSYLQQV